MVQLNCTKEIAAVHAAYARALVNKTLLQYSTYSRTKLKVLRVTWGAPGAAEGMKEGSAPAAGGKLLEAAIDAAACAARCSKSWRARSSECCFLSLSSSACRPQPLLSTPSTALSSQCNFQLVDQRPAFTPREPAHIPSHIVTHQPLLTRIEK